MYLLLDYSGIYLYTYLFYNSVFDFDSVPMCEINIKM